MKRDSLLVSALAVVAIFAALVGVCALALLTGAWPVVLIWPVGLWLSMHLEARRRDRKLRRQIDSARTLAEYRALELRMRGALHELWLLADTDAADDVIGALEALEVAQERAGKAHVALARIQKDSAP